MRRVFLFMPITLLVLVVLCIASAQYMTAERTIERSLTIEAPIHQVYPRIAHIRQWSGWYIPPEAGRFEGPEVGAGGTLIMVDPESQEVRRLMLTETSSPSSVGYKFPDKDQLPFSITGVFELETVAKGTQVTSRQHLAAQSPSDQWTRIAGERWFLYGFANPFVGSILERELLNLKKAIEGTPHKQDQPQ